MWAKDEYEIKPEAFRGRVERVRQFAVENNLAAVVVYSAPRIHQWSQTGHVGYISNWSNLDRLTDAMVVVPAEGEPVLLVAGCEYMLDQISEVSWMQDVRLVSSPDPRAIAGAYEQTPSGEVASFGQEIVHIIEQHGLANRAVSICGVEAMPHLLYQDLGRHIPGGISLEEDIVADLRGIKEAGEIEILRQTAAISDKAYGTIPEVLQEGMWGYELTAELDRTARSLGADLSYHCMHSGPGDDIRAGKLDIKAHDRRLQRGDYINVNAYVVYKGYWIQSDRTGTIGPGLGRQGQELFEANLKVQDKILEILRPGLGICEIVRLARESATELGYTLPGDRIGHGQGLDYAEKPFLTAGNRSTLQPGNVFVLHVCLGVPGTNIMLNPIADLCYITSSGVEILNSFPRGLFHAGK